MLCIRILILPLVIKKTGIKKLTKNMENGALTSVADPHLKSPPGSGSAWTDADPDPGGKKA